MGFEEGNFSSVVTTGLKDKCLVFVVFHYFFLQTDHHDCLNTNLGCTGLLGSGSLGDFPCTNDNLQTIYASVLLLVLYSISM